METVENLCEVWKDIPGYEGEYQQSTEGRTRSLDRFVNNRWGGKSLKKGRILKPEAHKSKDGFVYYRVKLSYGKQWYVHRLTLLTFVGPPPPDKPEVNHKDENTANNSLLNLEYCSKAYNCNYGTCIERRRLKNINGKKSRMIKQYTIDGLFIKEWPSMAEIHRTLGIPQGNVWKCCTGKYSKAGGYVWRYSSD